MRQQWYCEACDVLGSCVIPKKADAIDGVQRVSDSHARLSPKCAAENALKKVRVRSPNCSVEEWDKVRKDAQAKSKAGAESKKEPTV